MTDKRYLTKSRFQLACECPTKLFYTGKSEYANQNFGDSFLLALADGGFQVGELAKCYFPSGYKIDSLDAEQALAETNELLQSEQITIYEAAVVSGNCFIRADILVKLGNTLNLYEVKAKSYDPTVESFWNKNGTIAASWKSYLDDVAFQKYVITQAFPTYTISAHLILVDKSSCCPTEGLNQKFRFEKNYNGRKSIVVSPNLSAADLTPRILCEINVDAECEQIYSTPNRENELELNFTQQVHIFADHYAADIKFPPDLSTNCSSCEFYASPHDEKNGLKSGQKECWKEKLGWADQDFNSPTVLDVWNFRKKTQLLKDNCIKMSELRKEHIDPKPDKNPGISITQRQWLQIQKHQTSDNTVWWDRDNLRRVIDSWVYPLHFIDFETTMVAIPFNAGRRPYEGIAFQFSHHTIHEDGTIEHSGQYLNTEQGVFPNFLFLRELKIQLENDNGSIFRYSNHENTFLNTIYSQLQANDTIDDRDELCDFIKTISQSGSKSPERWVGKRNMVDMLEILKRHYYDPATKGSNSIKQVLPAMLNSSQHLKNKYSQPIYGSAGGIKSHNFSNWQWVEIVAGNVVDPYKRLPKMFQDVSDQDMRRLSDNDELKDGGAALTAYARLQFEEMTDYERQEIRQALLRYCGLDTMAMVMIYEGWKDLL